MGNQQSHIYQKISKVLPQWHEQGWEQGWFADKNVKPFQNQQDREQFIYAVITVITTNGVAKLDAHDFKLLFSRKPNDRMVATLVAMREGVIEAKIEPTADGKDQGEAFKAFKKHVELRLNELLETVPQRMPPVSSGPSTGFVASNRMPDMPPAYHEAGKMAGRSEKGDRIGG